ncbi:MAG: hypothetical protein ICV59_05630 [Thermoleophilia bacterium]|nr:hypothetical protein [Thermoleophilia bacterium]
MLLVGAIVLAIFWLPTPWGIAAIVGAAAIELAEVALWVWWSGRRRPAVGVEALPGRVGTVVSPCAPLGGVRVDGELWRARSDTPLSAGERVVIAAVDPDLTLHVRPFAADA